MADDQRIEFEGEMLRKERKGLRLTGHQESSWEEAETEILQISLPGTEISTLPTHLSDMLLLGPKVVLFLIALIIPSGESLPFFSP